MKFIVVCILLLLGIVVLSIQPSEGFFNVPVATPNIPTKVAITTCLSGNIVTIKARTTTNSTLSNVFLVNHSSKNEVGPEEFTDQILVSGVTIAPTESIIANIPLSRMVIGKKYYVIQVTVSSDMNAKKYQGNTVNTSRNMLLGIFTYAQPSACPTVAPPAVPPAVPPAAPVPKPAVPTNLFQSSLQQRTYDRQDPSVAAISDTGNDAMKMKQRMDILSDVQALLKKKKLEKRRLPCNDMEECEDDSCQKDAVCQKDDSCQKDRCAPSPALSQGREFSMSQPAPCNHDMSQYIRKDSIPCWKCNLDY